MTYCQDSHLLAKEKPFSLDRYHNQERDTVKGKQAELVALPPLTVPLFWFHGH